MSDQQTWDAVDALVAALAPEDEALTQALRDAADAGLPDIGVTPTQGKLLALLARSIGATRILELGTLAGYSTIWLARSLPVGGHLVTLEFDPAYAAVARTNLDRAGVGERVDIRVGAAVDTLAAMDGERFDLVFIDADKRTYPEYLEAVVPMTRPGGLIVCDNVVRGGGVADPDDHDPNTIGARRLLEKLATDPRLDATAIQTVGTKGHDGFALAHVR